MASQQNVYLDYAATAPLRPEAAEAMRDYLDGGDGFCPDANANSLHAAGRHAFSTMEKARKAIADVLHARPNELIFCSCATEADNAALWGITRVAAAKKKISMPHIVTSSIEHDAVFSFAKMLQTSGLAEVTFIKPQPSGHVSAQAVESAMRENTVLVSVIAAHNEFGAINDIEQIAGVAHNHNAFFHVDAVQALGKVDLDLTRQAIDAASFSAHKIGGPKGVGLLYASHTTPLQPLIHGGGQEGGKRSGTQNVCGICGFAAALLATCQDKNVFDAEVARQRNMRDMLYRELSKFENVHCSVPCKEGSSDYLCNIVNVCVDGFESETLILQLDLAGICVSGGSACSTHSLEPSRSLTEIGINRDRALCSLRISFGWNTKLNDCEAFLHAFREVISA